MPQSHSPSQTHTLPHTPTPTVFLIYSCTLPHICSLTHSYTLSLTQSHTLSHTHSHQLSPTHSHSLPHTLTRTLSHTLPHTRTHSPSHIHALTPTLSSTPSHTLTLSGSLRGNNACSVCLHPTPTPQSLMPYLFISDMADHLHMQGTKEETDGKNVAS